MKTTIHSPPTPLEKAVAQIEPWQGSPRLALLSESGGHWPRLLEVLIAGRVEGPQVHDARIGALGVADGVQELWTTDRDFSRFSCLRTRNPLVALRSPARHR